MTTNSFKVNKVFYCNFFPYLKIYPLKKTIYLYIKVFKFFLFIKFGLTLKSVYENWCYYLVISCFAMLIQPYANFT